MLKKKNLPLKGISARVDEVSLLGASVCTTISTLSLVVSGVVSVVVVVCKISKLLLDLYIFALKFRFLRRPQNVRNCPCGLEVYLVNVKP